jgi:hypothetical protein
VRIDLYKQTVGSISIPIGTALFHEEMLFLQLLYPPLKLQLDLETPLAQELIKMQLSQVRETFFTRCGELAPVLALDTEKFESYLRSYSAMLADMIHQGAGAPHPKKLQKFCSGHLFLLNLGTSNMSRMEHFRGIILTLFHKGTDINGYRVYACQLLQEALEKKFFDLELKKTGKRGTYEELKALLEGKKGS